MSNNASFSLEGLESGNSQYYGVEKCESQASGVDKTNTDARREGNPNISSQLESSHSLTHGPCIDSRCDPPLKSTATAPMISGCRTEAKPLHSNGGRSVVAGVEKAITSRGQLQVINREERNVIETNWQNKPARLQYGSDISDELLHAGVVDRRGVIIAHSHLASARLSGGRLDIAPHLARPEIKWGCGRDGRDQSVPAAPCSTCQRSSAESPNYEDNINFLDHVTPAEENSSERRDYLNANNGVIGKYMHSIQPIYSRSSNFSTCDYPNRKDTICTKSDNKVYNYVCRVTRVSLWTALRRVRCLFSEPITCLFAILLFSNLVFPKTYIIACALAATTSSPTKTNQFLTQNPPTNYDLIPDSDNLLKSTFDPPDISGLAPETANVAGQSGQSHQFVDSSVGQHVPNIDRHFTESYSVEESVVPNPAHLKDSFVFVQEPPKCHCGWRNFSVARPDHDRSFLFYLNPPLTEQLEVLLPLEVTLNLTHIRKPKSGQHSNVSDKTNTTVNNLKRKKRTAGDRTFPYQKSKSLRYERETVLDSLVSLRREKKSPHYKPNERRDEKDKDEEYFCVMLYSDDADLPQPFQLQIAAHWSVRKEGNARQCLDGHGPYLLMAVTAGRQHNFSVEARSVGRVTMSVATVSVDGTSIQVEDNSVYTVESTSYSLTAVRGERTADLVFNSAAAAIAIVISFGIGACTEFDSLKRQLKNPVALIIGFCCQFIIIPTTAFGIAMMLPLDKDIRFGLLCTACVPGGGLSHVAVIIADGDTGLSVCINIIAVIAMLATAPLWIFVLGQYFQDDADNALSPRSIPLHKFELWLAAAFFAFATGLLIKKIWPTVADNILMWLIKPFLLLAAILYITLGVYINMYVFELVNEYALLGAALLPFFGCVVGGVTAVLCRQSYTYIKTIALECSSFNCLVVMVALRYTLPQPDADLAAMIPIWVMFTIPGLFVALAICTKIKDTLYNYWRNRNSSKEEIQGSCKAYSVSSSVVSPPGTTTLSAPLVVADGLDDDATLSSDQKVTVL